MRLLVLFVVAIVVGGCSVAQQPPKTVEAEERPEAYSWQSLEFQRLAKYDPPYYMIDERTGICFAATKQGTRQHGGPSLATVPCNDAVMGMIERQGFGRIR